MINSGNGIGVMQRAQAIVSRVKIIALSSGIDLFRNDRILDKSWARKFPGAAWVPLLAEKLRSRKFVVTTADVALSHIKQGYWDIREVGVLQHLDDQETEELISLGAKPLVLTALESPLYAAAFYDHVDSIAPKFPQRVMFGGIFDQFILENGINHPLRFPCYSNEDIREILAWKDRHFMTMVVKNIYAPFLSPLFLRHPMDILKWIKRRLRISISGRSSWTKRFVHQQLHDQRLSAIIFFGQRNNLRLYGHGWESLENLPKYYIKKLAPLLERLDPKPCENKIETIMKYKFALSFENSSFSGGISEKLIDCFVAGVIPVYLGAPDIKDFVPKDAFIDAQEYKTWEELLDKLNTIKETEAKRMIDSGRSFLASHEGQLHTFEGFASFVEGLILQECNSPSSVHCVG